MASFPSSFPLFFGASHVGLDEAEENERHARACAQQRAPARTLHKYANGRLGMVKRAPCDDRMLVLSEQCVPHPLRESLRLVSDAAAVKNLSKLSSGF